MIQIGDIIINEKYVVAICPVDDDLEIVSAEESTQYAVRFSDRAQLCINATMEDIVNALAQ